MIANDPYAELERRFGRMSAVNRASAILNWDRSTMMPEGASEDRADQLATLGVISHEMMVAPDMADLLSRAEEGKGGLDAWRAANLREMRHAWTHENALPSDLVEARTRASSACEMAWREARKNRDFKALLPTLTEVRDDHQEGRRGQGRGTRPVALRRAARRIRAGRPLPAHRHAVRRAQVPSCRRCCSRSWSARRRPAQALPLDGPFPVEAQRTLGVEMAKTLGFDFRHGRLDVSAHPFTGGTADDVRITTRYDEKDFARALMGVLHETGHALYEAGLPRDWRRQPVGNARGMVLHESQSLLMEMQACRADAFIAYRHPRMRAVFGKSGPGLGGRQRPPDLHARGARLHPRRCRRGDLSAAHHAALPHRARGPGAATWRWPICRAPGTTA